MTRFAVDPIVVICGARYWEASGPLHRKKALLNIRAELPILITSGADDPVGGEQGVNELALHYTRSGHSRVAVRTYPGGRHEMLNETNRLEFSSDVLDWVENQLPGVARA